MLHKLSRAHARAGDDQNAERAAREAAAIALESDDAALRRACGLTSEEDRPADAGRYNRDFSQEEL
jgi:hypothetical protein